MAWTRRMLRFLRNGALLAAAMLPLGGTPLVAQGLPPGYQESVVASLGLPVTFDWDSGGALWIGTRAREVWIFDQGQLTQVAALDGSSGGERSLGVLRLDPDFDDNGHVWIYYTGPAPARNLLSRFTYNGTTLIDETIIVEGPLLDSAFHNGGCLEFASDGSIYLSMGDDLLGAATAQDPFDLRGSILHILPDGSGAPGNPFADGIRGRSEDLGERFSQPLSLQHPGRNRQPLYRGRRPKLLRGDQHRRGRRKLSAGPASRGPNRPPNPVSSTRFTAMPMSPGVTS